VSRNQEWTKEAACRGMNPVLFIDLEEQSIDTQLAIDAICASCPVRSKCETYGINTRSVGMFGRKHLKLSRELVNA